MEQPTDIWAMSRDATGVMSSRVPVNMLIDRPEMGRAGRKPGTRELVISRTPFIVIYRLHGERIELLRLLHGVQRWP